MENHRDTVHKHLHGEIKGNTDRSRGWERRQRELMLRLVNEYRAQRLKDPGPMNDISRAENLAVGHRDYSWKFSLYCAELVAMN